MKRSFVTRALVAGAVALLLSAGCKEEKAPEVTEPEPVVTAAPAPPPPATPAAVVDASKLPTEEDFEEEASRTITAQNVEAELDRLEKEISGS